MQMIATGFNGRFDRFGNAIRRGHATQDWTVGSKVNVGFLKGLTVISENKADNTYQLLSAKGVSYTFQSHFGISRNY